ncbi:DBH-like monooxygenase protein 1 [Orbicella faveolata]|uniref:DBH-like monooxygenase protein 1 n=1 Tax=Orbicella faveolata TaxID=48498 RepID=UPI0009E3D1FD|nr:DBH-like monooxygenase protein 1 [Orbicella faveolata]
MPAVDSQQNYHLISLTEDSGKTAMKFSRKFDTCDSEDNKIEAGTTKVIYAYNPDDPSSENSIPGHNLKNMGSRSLLLLNSLEKMPTLPSDTETFEILHDKMAIPKGRTNYLCAVFEMPKFNETHHMIKVEPVIQAGHEGVVHHMLLYECSDTFPDHHLNYTGRCYTRNMPPAVEDCTGGSSIAAWAIGGKEFYYPENAGFPLGRADSPKVVILEIHYDNPEEKEGTLLQIALIIIVEPVIQVGHEGVVHHMLLYECNDTFPDHHLNYTGHCYTRNMPPAIAECTGGSAMAAWAIGGKEFYYPENVGFPLGRADSPKIVILEIHYDNPEEKEGLIDSSGMRIYHTKQLRKYDAGVLLVGAGVDYTMLIPPRQRDWQTNGFCTKDCSMKVRETFTNFFSDPKGFKETKLPNGGINIFATLLHTHLAGRKTWLRHVRDGVELPEIARDDHYDFNFQEYHLLRNEVHVKPGDTMINVCIYNTEDRATGVQGGLATTDEMCLSFILYYPKVNVTKCMSREKPAYNAWSKKYYKQGDDPRKPSWWTDAVNTGLKDAYQEADQMVAKCSGRSNKPIEVISKSYSVGSFPLPPGLNACQKQGYPQNYTRWYQFIHLGGERHCESKVSWPLCNVAGPLDPETSALTMGPPCLPQISLPTRT